jgi:CheY-like chemotaxis protein
MAQLKILVVDDEPGIRSGVARILGNFHVTYPFMDEDYTFNILEAASGEEGIEIIDREMPDILLLDNKLPGIQGVEVLEYVRKKNYDIVVAMITSYASIDVAVRRTMTALSTSYPNRSPAGTEGINRADYQAAVSPEDNPQTQGGR